MMADAGIGRTFGTKLLSLVQGCDRGTGSLQGDVGYLDHERTSSAGQRMRKKGGDEQKSALPMTIVVFEQWICIVLGFVCMASGIWGICMKCGQYPLPAYLAWLGSLYVPTLRVAAVQCLVMGVVLVRRGWALP